MFFECENFEDCFERFGECPSDSCDYFRMCEYCLNRSECQSREDYTPDECPADRDALRF